MHATPDGRRSCWRCWRPAPGAPVTRLELEGAVPLSGAIAEAVATCFAHLSDLVLDYGHLCRPSDAVPARDAAAEYDHGCVQLLTLCGPRLQALYRLWTCTTLFSS